MLTRPMKLSDARMASLFLVSVSVLSFEIEVMRVFSVASWSNFGGMVIAIALLGFGLAGTLLSFLGDRVRRNPDAWLMSAAFVLGPAMAVAHTIAQHVPFNPVLIATDASQLWWIGAFYILYGLPFFAGGLFIGAIFTAMATRTHQLYFWNMLGSGMGGFCILGLMFIFPPGFLIFPVVGIAALPALLCCLRWIPAEERFRVRWTEAALSLLMAVISFLLLARYGALYVSDFKPISYAVKYPDAVEVYDAFSPLGELRAYSSSYFHFAPGLSDTAAVSLARMPRNAFLGLYVDGNGPVGVMRKLEPDEEGYIDYLPMSAPYLLLDAPKVLLLRLGGGAGIFTALHNGARSVWVVESNPELVHMLRDVPFFKAYTGGILEDRRVKVVNDEVRAFAGSTKERFNLAEIGLIDSIGLSQAGGYSVEENYIYTIEALREYLGCLAPSGILSITVWDRLNPPRNVPKLLATLVEALRREGISHPETRIFAFNLLLSTATVLVKNGDFTSEELGTLNAYCRRMSFEVNYSPGMPIRAESFEAILEGYAGLYRDEKRASPPSGEKPDIDLRPGDLYHFSLEWMLSGKERELFSRYIFDIRPATDDRPYYSGYLKPRTVPLFLGKLAEISEEWGYLLLLGTFLQSLAFGVMIISLPLGGRWRELFRGRKGTFGVIVYYACLGIGYMMAEIFLIQRFVFFLADPVYANSIVITVLLVSSGVGSLMGAKFQRRRNTAVRSAVLGIVVFVLFFLFALSPLLQRLLGMPLPFKALIAAAVIAPLGLCLGIPFPCGLSALSESRRAILPWAWGVNGAFSVTGSTLTRIISTSAGFSAVLVGVALLYAIAGVLFPVNAIGAPAENRLPGQDHLRPALSSPVSSPESKGARSGPPGPPQGAARTG